MLSEEDASLLLKDENGVEHIAHEGIDAQKEDSAVQIKSSEKQLRLVECWICGFVCRYLVIKSSFILETNSGENANLHKCEEYLLTNFSLALHGVSLNSNELTLA